MTKVTVEHIDAIYDAVTCMRLFSQVLSEGEVDDQKAGEISWLLGSAKKRLEPIINLLEEIQFAQVPSLRRSTTCSNSEPRCSPCGSASPRGNGLWIAGITGRAADA